MFTLPGAEITTLPSNFFLDVELITVWSGSIENITLTFLLFSFLVIFALCIKVIIKRDRELKLAFQNGRPHNLLEEKEKEFFAKAGEGGSIRYFFQKKIIKIKRSDQKTETAIREEVTVSFLPYHLIIVRQLYIKFQGFSEIELLHYVLLYMGVSVEETAKKLQVSVSHVQVQRCRVRSKILKSGGSNLKLYMNSLVLN